MKAKYVKPICEDCILLADTGYLDISFNPDPADGDAKERQTDDNWEVFGD